MRFWRVNNSLADKYDFLCSLQIFRMCIMKEKTSRNQKRSHSKDGGDSWVRAFLFKYFKGGQDHIISRTTKKKKHWKNFQMDTLLALCCLSLLKRLNSVLSLVGVSQKFFMSTEQQKSQTINCLVMYTPSLTAFIASLLTVWTIQQRNEGNQLLGSLQFG